MGKRLFLKNGTPEGKINKETIIIDNLKESQFKLLSLLVKGMDETSIACALGISLEEVWENIDNLETCFYSILFEKNLKSIRQYAKQIAAKYNFC